MAAETQLNPKQYLLGYEFPSTLVVFWKQTRKVTFVCGTTKGKSSDDLP